MPTFEVDDKLHSHPKAADAGDDALGAWVRIGSWCCDYLTDGCVPRGQAGRLAGDTQWTRLVSAGFVEVLANGDYQLHDFLHWNRPASFWHAQRSKSASKKRDQRARARAEATLSRHVSPGDTPRDVPRHVPGESPVSPAPSGSDPSDQVTASPPAQADAAELRKRSGRRSTSPASPPINQAVGWDLWRPAYQSTWQTPYVGDRRADGKHMAAIVAAAAEAAGGRGGGDGASRVRDVLSHWFRCYLADEGRHGFLREARHPLRLVLRDVTRYGEPDPAQADPEPPRKPATAAQDDEAQAALLEELRAKRERVIAIQRRQREAAAAARKEGG